jgi:histidinol phosphatase-like enzyme
MGGHIDGHFLCPHANRTYVDQHPEYHFFKELVCDCDCIKPGTGMVFDALKSEEVAPEDVDIYVIGDRATDVETALNINGTGILIPFENEPGEEEKVENLKAQSNIYIARNLLEAAEFINHKSSSGSTNI